MNAASTVLMVRPVNFGYNEQTAVSNVFQQRQRDGAKIQFEAASQFDLLVNLLIINGIKVLVVNDTPEPHTPDSIFPNNWLSTHENGDIFLYPMEAANRRLERRTDIIDLLKQNFRVNRVYDLSYFEERGNYLEGTGSMVLDRENKIAYAGISSRTNLKVLDTFCRKAGYSPFVFHPADPTGVAIYHTNVMMCVGHKFAVICLDSIHDTAERSRLTEMLQATKKSLIELTFKQMFAFAGNMIELSNMHSQPILVMSDTAYKSLDDNQKSSLHASGTVVHSKLDIIEKTGGGSARCMIAEIFLQSKEDFNT